MTSINVTATISREDLVATFTLMTPNPTDSCNGQNGSNGHYCHNGCNNHNGCDGCNEYNGFLDNLDLSERPGVLT